MLFNTAYSVPDLPGIDCGSAEINIVTEVPHCKHILVHDLMSECFPLWLVIQCCCACRCTIIVMLRRLTPLTRLAWKFCSFQISKEVEQITL